ncbi:MAG TPA: NlpC/P60 family protein [Verrucomicrobiae bacterium]|nr:NlpC/P60 family protein [Verrucomicrobiae bacterium]
MNWLTRFRFKVGRVESKSKWRKHFFVFWRLALCLWLVLLAWPVKFRATRGAEFLLVLILWCGGLCILGSWRALRLALLSAGVFAVMMLSLPGRDTSPSELRVRYLRELRRFEGTRYVWGGENSLGIDCSGLVRRAFINALWKEGFQSLNPRLLRSALTLWWHDNSARALAAEFRGLTVRIGSVDSLLPETPPWLAPGDLAVTDDGIHVLAYLGNGLWIEADPDIGRVTFLPVASRTNESNIWLSVPVTIVRWRMLQDAGDLNLSD